jgi:tRNA (guanine10-N2)-methyltransferase
MSGWKQYLVHFLDDWLDFRLAEFVALLELNNLDPSQVIIPSDNVCFGGEANEVTWKKCLDAFRYSPKVQHFLIIRLPNDLSAKCICDRAVLVKAIYSLWAHDYDFRGMLDKLRVNIADTDITLQVESEKSWCVQIQSFGKTYSMEQKQLLRNQAAFIPFRGPVNLSSPYMEMWIIIDFTTNFPEKGDKLSILTEDDLNPKKYSYFGRKVASNSIVKQFLCKYDLKKRSYLGPTSLDCLLTFILSNVAKVVPNMICYEPFMGTGSIAIALTHLQAMVFGSDIDPRVLRGEMHAGKFQESNNGPQSISTQSKKKRDVLQTFVEYDLPLPELIRMDHHLLERHFHFPVMNSESSEEHTPIGFFNAIVTDPPYGIRAGAKKSGNDELLVQ